MEIRFSKSAMRALFKSNKRQLIRQKIDELEAESLSQNANVIRPKADRNIGCVCKIGVLFFASKTISSGLMILARAAQLMR